MPGEELVHLDATPAQPEAVPSADGKPAAEAQATPAQPAAAAPASAVPLADGEPAAEAQVVPAEAASSPDTATALADDADAAASDPEAPPAKKRRSKKKSDDEKPQAKAKAKGKAKAKAKANATGSQQAQQTLSAFATKQKQPEFKLAFYGEISFKKTYPCITIARFNLDGGSDDAEIYMIGVVTPGSAQWPSLPWNLPSTIDTSDATMNLEYVETTITHHNKEIQFAMPYLTLSGESFDKYKAGSWMPMIRQCLPCEQSNQHKKDSKKKITSFDDGVAALLAEEFGAPSDALAEPQPSPKAKAKANNSKVVKKAYFRHIEHPELILASSGNKAVRDKLDKSSK